MTVVAEKRICTWTPDLPELHCEGSIPAAINSGSWKMKLHVEPSAWENVRAARRIAVIDQEAWRVEATIESAQHLGDGAVELILVPAGFPCDSCHGVLAGAVCDLCKGGEIPPQAIKGEWYVPELGSEAVVDGPGVYEIPPSGPLAHKAYPRDVDAQWRPCEN